MLLEEIHRPFSYFADVFLIEGFFDRIFQCTHKDHWISIESMIKTFNQVFQTFDFIFTLIRNYEQ